MMKKIVFSILFILIFQNGFTLKDEKANVAERISSLEKKVLELEKRLNNIESKISITKPNLKDKDIKSNPLKIIYVSKDKLTGSKKAGIRLNLKIYNPTNLRISAFMGDIILEDNKGKEFYRYRFYYNQIFEPESYVDAVILILDNQGDIYFKVLKMENIKVKFINQKIYTKNEI